MSDLFSVIMSKIWKWCFAPDPSTERVCWYSEVLTQYSYHRKMSGATNQTRHYMFFLVECLETKTRTIWIYDTNCHTFRVVRKYDAVHLKLLDERHSEYLAKYWFWRKSARLINAQHRLNVNVIKAHQSSWTPEDFVRMFVVNEDTLEVRKDA